MRVLRALSFGIFALMLILLAAPFTANAASITSIQLTNTKFVQCNSFDGVFVVSFNVIAYNGSLVANDGSPVTFDIVTTTPYGTASYQTSALAGDTLTVATYFPTNSPISSGSVQVFAAGRTVSSVVYVVDCTSSVFTPYSGPGDGRLNPSAADLVNVLYNASTDGKSAIAVYEVTSGSRGVLIGYFTTDDFALYQDSAPAANTVIKTIGKSTLYALTSGEFQVNIGPDAGGKYGYIIFSGLPAASIKRGIVE